MSDELLKLNNICSSCNGGTLGTVMSSLYTKLKSTPSQRYDGDLLTNDQKKLLNNMCGVANKVSLGTIVADLLSASKNGTAVTIISDDYASMINNMCLGIHNVLLGELIQELAEIINDMAYSTEANILTYTLPGQIGETVFDEETDNIMVTMPMSADLTNLIATFTLSEGAIAKILDVEQESGVTANDFSMRSITYTIFAEERTTSKNWIVDIIVQNEGE